MRARPAYNGAFLQWLPAGQRNRRTDKKMPDIQFNNLGYSGNRTDGLEAKPVAGMDLYTGLRGQ